jgi:hypothetical protein
VPGGERRVAVAGRDVEHLGAAAQVDGLAELFADDLQRGADRRIVARGPGRLLLGLQGGEIEEYGFRLSEEIGTGYDGVIVAVSHKEYTNLDESYFMSICNENSFILDLKGLYRGTFKSLEYWSL